MARLRARVAAHLAQAQHRNAYCLLLNNVLGAATGLLFLLIFTRVLGLAPEEVGFGYAIVVVGTMVGVVAKGGLDTAILRFTPGIGHEAGRRLFRFAVAVGAAAVALLAVALAAASHVVQLSLDGTAVGWLLVVAIALLLVVTWLQDARFLAGGDARPSLKRNLVLSGARLLAPLPIVALAMPRPVALSTALALALSALAGSILARRLPRDPALAPPPRPAAFLATSLRNAASSAAEFLPGLLLVPLVLAVAGAAAAAFFAMAWTAASLLFLASSALSRSALAEIVRKPDTMAHALRRGALQHAVLILPAAVLAAVLAPEWLSFFGPSYAAAGQSTLVLLAVSIVLVAPGNLYLAVLRARDSPVALAAFPAAMIVTLLLLAPPLLQVWGLPGVAVAWMVANAPLGLVGAWRLRSIAARRFPAATSTAGGAP
ncbi:MAG: hypothetical protein ABR562_01835 [Thermoplasmatota archaeon]|nr:hypothetical protein [Halobacteriales archaeon]